MIAKKALKVCVGLHNYFAIVGVLLVIAGCNHLETRQANLTLEVNAEIKCDDPRISVWIDGDEIAFGVKAPYSFYARPGRHRLSAIAVCPYSNSGQSGEIRRWVVKVIDVDKTVQVVKAKK